MPTRRDNNEERNARIDAVVRAHRNGRAQSEADGTPPLRTRGLLRSAKATLKRRRPTRAKHR